MSNMQNGIYQKLRKKIIFLDYAPGQSLTAREMAKQFHVSSTPIREALIRLEGEGLVRRFPNKSVHVTEVSFQDLKDVFETRLFLMDLVGKLATHRITDPELTQMQKLLQKMKKETDRNTLLHIDDDFHQLVNTSTKNKALSRSLKVLRTQATRLWFFVKEDEAYARQMVEDFEVLIAALQNRDEEQCRKVLRDHVRAFVQLVKASILEDTSTKPEEYAPR